MRDSEGNLHPLIVGKTIRLYSRDVGETGIGRLGLGKVVKYVPNEFIVLEPPDETFKKTAKSAEESFLKVELEAGLTVVPLEDVKNITILD